MPKKDTIEPIDATFDELVGAVAPRATHLGPASEPVVAKHEIVEYTDPGNIEAISFRLDPGAETIWATQAQIAALFDTNQSNVSYHLKNVFADGELDQEGNIKKFDIAGSTKPVALYSLDAVISVGYRVNSKAATRFRRWATGIIKAYIEQGYAINEKALRESPEKLNRLAAEIRALRSEEKQVYQKVRDCFKISASDYDPSSAEMKRFYALLQDKFHYAITKMEGAKLIMDRVQHTDHNMGVRHFRGKEPTLKEATTAKNLLDKEELYRLHILSEQFLLYAEATALAGKKMTMASLHKKLDGLLEMNEYPVFQFWDSYLKDRAEDHARKELILYKKRKKIEALGIDYDLEALEDGEYDDILIE